MNEVFGPPRGMKVLEILLWKQRKQVTPSLRMGPEANVFSIVEIGQENGPIYLETSLVPYLD